MASSLGEQENVYPGMVGGVGGTQGGTIGGGVDSVAGVGVRGDGGTDGDLSGPGVSAHCGDGNLSQEFRKLSASQEKDEGDFDDSTDDWMVTQTTQKPVAESTQKSCLVSVGVAGGEVDAEDGGRTGSGGEWSQDDDDFLKLAKVKEGAEVYTQNLDGPVCKVARLETLETKETSFCSVVNAVKTSTQKSCDQKKEIPQAVLDVCSSIHEDDDENLEVMNDEAKKLLFEGLDAIDQKVLDDICEPNSGEALAGDGFISYQTSDLVADDEDDFGGDIYQGEENECYSSDEELYETQDSVGSIFEDDADGQDQSRLLDRPATPPSESVKYAGVGSDCPDLDKAVGHVSAGVIDNNALNEGRVDNGATEGNAIVMEDLVGGGSTGIEPSAGVTDNNAPTNEARVDNGATEGNSIIMDDEVGGGSTGSEASAHDKEMEADISEDDVDPAERCIGLQVQSKRTSRPDGIPGLPGFSDFDQRGRSEGYINNQLSTMTL